MHDIHTHFRPTHIYALGAGVVAIAIAAVALFLCFFCSQIIFGLSPDNSHKYNEIVRTRSSFQWRERERDAVALLSTYVFYRISISMFKHLERV